LGWKDKNNQNENEVEVKDNQSGSPVFRDKEKVLVTCSRRIGYR
jgi:ribosome biogenesis protein BRX1